MRAKHQSRWVIAIICLAFFLLGFAYSVINPLHEATDELRHYRFVQHIVQRGSLPVQGEMSCSAQGHHPPLYYGLAALATGWIDTGRDVCYEPPANPFWDYQYWEIGRDNKNQYLHGADEAFPWSGEALAAHLARVVNILIGTAVVFVTWAIGRTIWPDRPYLAAGGAAIVAFNPMFLFMAGAINNDVIAALAGAAVTLGLVRFMRDEQGLRLRWGIILGLLYGFALLSKFNLAAIIIPIELSVTWVAWRKKQWRQWLLVNVLLVVSTLLVAGWWFVRNQILYGEPTGFQRLTELWGVRNPADSLDVALYELPYVWTSLWGRFGYGQVPLHQWIYDLLWWLAVIAVAGLLIPVLKRDKEELHQYGAFTLLLLLNVIIFFGVIFNYLLVSPAGPMGRFFFPALPSLALLLIYGATRWTTLLQGSPRPAEKEPSQNKVLVAIVSIGMITLALVALFGYLAPAYAKPPSFASGAEIPNPIDAHFDAFVTLRGYKVQTAEIHPGESFIVDLYWEVNDRPPGDFLQFLHLIDSTGTMVAQRDTHPGLGSFPSSQWAPGDRFVDSIRLTIPETAYAPEQATLSVGYYAPVEGYRLGVSAADGEPLGDALPLATISILPVPENPEMIPNRQEQNFENKILLTGYEYNKRQFNPGESLELTLYWQALEDELMDYEVQLRLLDETGQIMKTIESPLLAGGPPTSAWQKGELTAASYALPLRASLPRGVYHVQVAVQDAEHQARLNIVADDGHWIDNRLRLAGIKVGD